MNRRNHSSGNHEVFMHGSFAPAAAGAPTDVFGTGFTVTRSSQGLFLLTLQERFVRLRAGTVTLQLSAAGLVRFACLGLVDVATAGTVEIRVTDAAAAVQDIVANANNRVHFELVLSRDTVTA